MQNSNIITSIPNNLISFDDIQIENLNFDNIDKNEIDKLAKLINEIGMNVIPLIVNELSYIEYTMQYQLIDNENSKLIYLACKNSKIDNCNAIILRKKSSSNDNMISQYEMFLGNHVEVEVEKVEIQVPKIENEVESRLIQIEKILSNQQSIIENLSNKIEKIDKIEKVHKVEKVEKVGEVATKVEQNEDTSLNDIQKVQRFTKKIVEKFFQLLQINQKVVKNVEGKWQLLDNEGNVICSTKDEKYIVQRYKKQNEIENVEISFDIQVNDFVEIDNNNFVVKKVDENLITLSNNQVIDIAKFKIVNVENDENLGMNFIKLA